MITKTVIKDYVLKKCPYLVSLELEDKTLIGLLKESIELKRKYLELAEEESSINEDNDSSFDLYEVLKDYPHLKSEILEFEKNINKNPVEKLIDQYNDNQLISKLSRRYFELIYGKEHCKSCDIDEHGNSILNQTTILNSTSKYLNDGNVKVIFEGQLEKDNLRARFDILIKNDDGSFDLIEVKGTNDVFEHPNSKKESNYTLDNKIKPKYLYDLLFQYYIYKNNNINLRNIGYMFTNRNFEIKNPIYPLNENELKDLFIIKTDINLKNGTISIKEYFDDNLYVDKDNESIENIINNINTISKSNNIIAKKQYNCKKGPACPFIELCFKDASNSDSIFKLTNWNLYGGNYLKTKKIMELGIEKISDISIDEFNEFDKNGKRLNVYTQIKYQKGLIKEKYVIDTNKIKEIITKDYLNDNVKWLIFFDFESFQHCIPLVYNSKPWKQVVSQYSMHIVKNNYDLSKHDFKNGNGGNVTHFEFIGFPDNDQYENPSIKLYKTLKEQLESQNINPFGNDYKVVVFNKNFEKSRMKEFVQDFKEDNPVLTEFVNIFNDNVVDLLDFFTSGAIYCKDFNGRGSLKIIQPTLAADKDVLDFYENKLSFSLTESLDYHKGDKCLVYNGAICLDLYKSLLIRSHLNKQNEGISTKELLNEALAYCKIDSWGTVIIYDIIKNIYEGNLSLDSFIL